MTTDDVAARLGIGPRAVVKAIADRRLRAHKPGRQWVIEREDFAHFEAARRAG